MITTINEFKKINEIYDADIVHDDFEIDELNSINDLIKQTTLNNKIKAKKIIGYGSNGIVALTNDNNVIKFCLSYREVQLLQKTKKHEFKHIVKIYDIFKVKYKTKNNRLSNGWLIYKEYIPNLPKNIEKEIDDIDIKYNGYHDKSFRSIPKTNIINQLLEIEKELQIIGLNKLSDADINSSNIGWKNNKLIVFDFIFD